MDKRSHYIKESLKLFLKYGIRTVTVGQITAQLNISSKTLYLLFGDKTGLVYACFQLYAQNSQKAYEKLEQESENVADLLIRFYNKLVESFGRINPNFFNDISAYFPELWNSDEAFGLEQTRQLLRRGVEEALFVPHLEVPVCAETLTMLLRSMFEKESFEGRGMPLLLTNVLWPYVRGLCTARGLEEFRKYRKVFTIA
ncbi:MAG: TetR/AcrR family transcriptional regulator [Bacteroidia bacterium]|nr:TetR/AcrR family transcriptional regulator [Bacteroidia bacterium]